MNPNHYDKELGKFFMGKAHKWIIFDRTADSDEKIAGDQDPCQDRDRHHQIKEDVPNKIQPEEEGDLSEKFPDSQNNSSPVQAKVQKQRDDEQNSDPFMKSITGDFMDGQREQAEEQNEINLKFLFVLIH